METGTQEGRHVKKRTEIDRETLSERLCSKFGTMSARYLRHIQPICLEVYKLNINAWRVMSNIARNAPISASDIGNFTSLEADKITRATNLLVKQGLVDRRDDARDRRRVILTLTDRGWSVSRAIMEAGVEYERQLLDVLNDRERTALLEYVDRVLARSRELEDVPRETPARQRPARAKKAAAKSTAR